MASNLTKDKQVLFDAVPVTGTVSYKDLSNALLVAGNKTAIRQFHDMRRAGEIVVSFQPNPDGKGRLMFVARPGQVVANG
jgi:hypothetical protein